MSSGRGALLLFDIDGTLVRRSGPHHRQALVDAVEQLTGHTTTTESIPVQGMLDGDILAAMLGQAGLAPERIPQLLPALMRRAQYLYSRNCPKDLSEAVCPGVIPFLQAARRHLTVTGLVSGNLTRIGWKKMERAGLKPFFPFGAFADQGQTRGELVALAMKQARSQGWLRRGGAVSLVGDHPNDIRAAKENGVRSIAVATGVVPASELASHRPDILVDTLRDLRIEQVLH